MEWSAVYKVATLAFMIGALFGAVANKTNFCAMGAVADWVNFGDKNRLRAWFLALGIAILMSQGLQVFGLVNLAETRYLSTDFRWLGYLLGGGLFGIGMTLASGCGQRTLVRAGGGNLKSLVVIVFLGLTAYMTMRGVLAIVRVELIQQADIDLRGAGIVDQGIGTLIAAAAGLESVTLVNRIVAALIGGGLITYAFWSATFRRSFNDVLAGVIIGLIIPAGWYVTGMIGFDDFEPVPLESWSFVAPTAEALQYLMTFTGSTISFGVAAVGGVVFGSFIYSVCARKFRIEAFIEPNDMVRHIVGGVMMGFGGVLAMGCTIGQGITGMSTLALGSLMAMVAIIFGSALTMKVQYYLLDELGIVAALRHALADMNLAPRRTDQRP